MVSPPPAAFWIGATLVFAALPCPVAIVAGRSIPFMGTGYGLAIGLVGVALLVIGLLRHPVDAPIVVVVMAAVAAGLVLVLLGAVTSYGGAPGWGWVVVATGLALAMVGARSWAAAEV